MSTTKKIYFLSAIVLIIGCFALNLSYSLFVQTEEKEVVSASIPYINSGLSLTSISVEPGEYLIKQTVNNFGTADFNYAINANSSSSDYSVHSVTDGIETYTGIGILEANNSKDLYFVITNTSSDTIVVDFNIDKKYTTLDNDLITNIDSENIYSFSVGLPFKNNTNTLAYKIIKQYVDTDAYNGAVINNLSDLFKNNETKVELPISTDLGIESPTFNSTATEELGLFQSEDDYGTSYYYRGASSVNYVNFAGFTWRIVRINGDGTIRLILDGTLDKVTREGETTKVYENDYLDQIEQELQDVNNLGASNGITGYNKNNEDNAYLGYMYGTPGSTSYDNTHNNVNSSVIKLYLEAFYKEYLLDYEKYIADTMFCGDKTLAKSNIGSSNTAYGYKKSTTYYAASERLMYSNGTSKIANALPTLECAKGETNTYSRYTSKKDLATTTSKGVEINNDLEYPIGLLSADELVMAGAFRDSANQSYYLYTTDDKLNTRWYLMTPYYFSSRAYLFASVPALSSLYSAYSTTYIEANRPVINLRSDIEIKNGDGSVDAPYEIQEIVE